MKETTAGAKETAAPSASINFLVSPVCPSFPNSTTSFPEPSSLPSCFSSSSSASPHCPTALSGSHPSSSPSCPSSVSIFPSSLRSVPPGSSSSSSSSVFPPLSYAVEACPPVLRAGGARKEGGAAPAAAEAEKWEEHPLFMTSMPSGEAFKRNPLLAALAAVIDEEEQLPFRAQRRRGRGGERRRDEEQEQARRDKATTRKESLAFSSEQDVERASALLKAEGRCTTVVEKDIATAVAQKRRAGNRTARPTAAAATYRSHRSSCVPYAARQRATVGKCENEEEGEEAAECTLSSEATALETETELQRDAPASMGELQICMKMWQM